MKYHLIPLFAFTLLTADAATIAQYLNGDNSWANKGPAGPSQASALTELGSGHSIAQTWTSSGQLPAVYGPDTTGGNNWYMISTYSIPNMDDGLARNPDNSTSRGAQFTVTSPSPSDGTLALSNLSFNFGAAIGGVLTSGQTLEIGYAVFYKTDTDATWRTLTTYRSPVIDNGSPDNVLGLWDQGRQSVDLSALSSLTFNEITFSITTFSNVTHNSKSTAISNIVLDGVVQIPEPVSSSLALLGLFGVALRRKRSNPVQ